MRWTCGIGFTESVDTEYRPPGGHCGVELVRMVGQEEEPAADQRGQLTAAGMGEPILLIANRTR